MRSASLAAALKQYQVPVVNVSGSTVPGADFPRVSSDAAAVRRMAVDHLYDCGLRTIAFCGERGRRFVEYWTVAYQQVIKQRRLRAHIYTHAPGITQRSGYATIQHDRERWLEELLKPAGVIGWDTKICRELAGACEWTGLAVPDEVALISLSTEDLIGRAAHPPLSGVDIALQRIGYEAAQILDGLMEGARPPAEPFRIPPLGVTTRQSTDVLAVDDDRVRQALRFIREHESESIDVRDVLHVVLMARRVLERRFQQLLGRTPAEEIRRVHLEKVKRLLIESDLPIPEVDEASGFQYVEHMIPVFKKHFGMTPLAFRKQARPR